MKAPFPYHGTKYAIAPLVWDLFDPNVSNYIEPFAGAISMLLSRPGWSPSSEWVETVNDVNGFIVNFWRATKYDPDTVAQYTDNPVFENDFHAIHATLSKNNVTLVEKLEGDPEYFDPKIAGWWAWGMSTSIFSQFCINSQNSSWHIITTENNEKILKKLPTPSPEGIRRVRPQLSSKGVGLNKKGARIQHPKPYNPYTDGNGTNGTKNWLKALSERLKYVRVCCGDWERVCSKQAIYRFTPTAIFLDPPYSGKTTRTKRIYSSENLAISDNVRTFCLENGNNPSLRIVLCGYEGEHNELEKYNWTKIAWEAKTIGKKQNKLNAKLERLWVSPHCILNNQQKLEL